MANFKKIAEQHTQQIEDKTAQAQERAGEEAREEDDAWMAFQQRLVQLIRPSFERECKQIHSEGLASTVIVPPTGGQIELRFSLRKGDTDITDANACVFAIMRERGSPRIKWSQTILRPRMERDSGQLKPNVRTHEMPFQYLTEAWLEHQLDEFYRRAFSHLAE